MDSLTTAYSVSASEIASEISPGNDVEVAQGAPPESNPVGSMGEPQGLMPDATDLGELAFTDFGGVDSSINGATEFDFNSNADWIWSVAALNEPYGSFDLDMSGSRASLAPPSNFPLLADLQQPLQQPQQQPPQPVPQRQSQTSQNICPGNDDEISTDEEDHDEVTTQIADRLGTMLASKNGEWRFYGATSNLHLMKGRSAWDAGGKQSSQGETQTSARLELFRVAHSVDARLVRHLIMLYFAWHNVSLHVVDQEVFLPALEAYLNYQERSKFVSEFLISSM